MRSRRASSEPPSVDDAAQAADAPYAKAASAMIPKRMSFAVVRGGEPRCNELLFVGQEADCGRRDLGRERDRGGCARGGAAASTVGYSEFVEGRSLHASDQRRRTERKKSGQDKARAADKAMSAKAGEGASVRLICVREAAPRGGRAIQSEPNWVCSSSDPCFATRR